MPWQESIVAPLGSEGVGRARTAGATAVRYRDAARAGQLAVRWLGRDAGCAVQPLRAI